LGFEFLSHEVDSLEGSGGHVRHGEFYNIC
jgi:hypothetical protein